MPYQVKQPNQLSEEIRRIVQEQIERAIREIDDGKLAPEEVVHQVRKRCKKVRAVLRLGRGCLDDDGIFKRENAWFRDAARGLSFARDAAALIKTYDRLMTHFSEQVDRPKFGSIRRKLTMRHQEIAGCDIDSHLVEFRERMVTGLDRVSKWAKSVERSKDLASGMEQTYRRGREAMSAAYDDPSPERFHEWRKRTKYHWYHCRLLEGAWPAVMKARKTELSRLADFLGDEHDLTVFRETLTLKEDPLASPSTLKAVLGLIDQRRKELRTEADPLGKRLFAEKPKHLTRRIRSYANQWIHQE